MLPREEGTFLTVSTTTRRSPPRSYFRTFPSYNAFRSLIGLPTSAQRDRSRSMQMTGPPELSSA